MDLGFFKDISNNIKENEGIQNFIKELGEFLEQTASKLIQNSNGKNEVGILEEIQSKRNVSVASKNQIRDGIDEILDRHTKETDDRGGLYFVAGKSSKERDTYIIYKYENGEDTAINLKQKDLPAKAELNSVLRYENNKYILDEELTQNVINEIKEMADEVLDKQDDKLRDYRKEGHLYMVEEDVNNRIYLWDMTDKPSFTIEEVDFPENLKSQATEGTVFQYIDGEYKFYNQ